MKKVLYYILEFIFLCLSYLLCNILSEKINLFVGIIVALTLYLIVGYVLNKILMKD